MKKRFFALAMSFALLFCWGTQAAFAAEPAAACTVVSCDPADYENGEVLVLYRDGTCAVETYGEEELAAALEAFAARDDVLLVQPNYSYENDALSVNDTYAGLQWALSNDGSFTLSASGIPYTASPELSASGVGSFAASAIGASSSAVAGIDVGAEEAWSLFGEGKRDVVIALIDTGADVTHADLSGSLWVNEDEIPGNGIDDDANGYIDDANGWNFYHGSSVLYTGAEDNHGTHGLGTIAASANNGAGVSGLVRGSHIKVMVLKVLGGEKGTGTTSSVIEAIRYAEANGASICNLSFGGSQHDPALYAAMAGSSMLFVAAAGNEGTNNDVLPSYPASYNLTNLISVANLSFDGTLHATSNTGAVSVDLAAPGTYILSTITGSRYAYMTGTSMAAPMVTAAAAMVYSYFDAASLSAVCEILLSTAEPLDSLKGLTATGGMLDLAAALREGGALAGSSGSSAPQLTVQTVSSGGVSYVKVQAFDPNGDLVRVAYSAGTLSLTEFRDASAGMTVSLAADGTALIPWPGAGTYSFCALDAAGNATVVYVKL